MRATVFLFLFFVLFYLPLYFAGVVGWKLSTSILRKYWSISTTEVTKTARGVWIIVGTIVGLVFVDYDSHGYFVTSHRLSVFQWYLLTVALHVILGGMLMCLREYVIEMTRRGEGDCL